MILARPGIGAPAVADPCVFRSEPRTYFDLKLDQPHFYSPNGAGRVRTDVRMFPSDDEQVEGAEERGLEFLERRVGITRDQVRQSARQCWAGRAS